MNSNKRDIYFDGRIYKDVPNHFHMEVEHLKADLTSYPVQGSHAFKDGEYVTGRYELGFDSPTCHAEQVAIPLPTPAPVAEQDDVGMDIKLPCICMNCNKAYNHDLIVSDELWVIISPRKLDGWKTGGLLCPECILDKTIKFYTDTVLRLQPPDETWISVSDKLPKSEGYYKVKFSDGTEDEKPFRIRPSKNIYGFMTENKVTHWKIIKK